MHKNKIQGKTRAGAWIVFIILIMAAAGLRIIFAQDQENTDQEQNKGRYVGVEKCIDCHDQDETGNQYNKWKEKKHAAAYDTLGLEQAKEIAKKQGIEDPTKDDKCLKCHITAFGEPKERIDESFNVKFGVQCETCHGPGSPHLDGRAAAAFEAELTGDFPSEEDILKYKELPEGEVSYPDQKLCESCHNKESPTYKEFKYEEELKNMQHHDPRKKRD